MGWRFRSDEILNVPRLGTRLSAQIDEVAHDRLGHFNMQQARRPGGGRGVLSSFQGLKLRRVLIPLRISDNFFGRQIENTFRGDMTYALILVALLLLVGVVMREQLPIFRWLFIPASVIAGLVGLAIFQAADAMVNPSSEPGVGGATWFADLSNELSRWPGGLIAVVFAAMLLVRKEQAGGHRMRRVGQQGLMVWIIVLGETAVGLLVTWLIVQAYFEVPNSFGMLIETGFAGGHGTAAAMGEVFSHPTVNLAAGKDLGHADGNLWPGLWNRYRNFLDQHRGSAWLDQQTQPARRNVRNAHHKNGGFACQGI